MKLEGLLEQVKVKSKHWAIDLKKTTMEHINWSGLIHWWKNTF